MTIDDTAEFDRGGPKYTVDDGTYEVKLVDINPCTKKWKDEPEKPGYKFTFMLETEKGPIELGYTTSRSLNEKEGMVSNLVKLLKVFSGSAWPTIRTQNSAIVQVMKGAIGRTYLANIETTESGYANIQSIAQLPKTKTTTTNGVAATQ